MKSFYSFVTGIILLSLFFAPKSLASEACEIIDDIPFVFDVRERSIPLLQFGDVYLRAASGKIRCKFDEKSDRQICTVDGQGELFIEGGDNAAHVIQFNTDKIGEAHVYSNADLSCGLQSDFK